MAITACMPWITLLKNFAIKALYIWRDRGFHFRSTETVTTKCKNQQQYLNLYAGAEYKLCFQYSSVLTQVCVSFLYGMCVPLLFPITLFGIFNMYMNDRLLLAYFYKQPPKYDMDIHLESLSELYMAPILSFLLGYWALGNR